MLALYSPEELANHCCKEYQKQAIVPGSSSEDFEKGALDSFHV
jgi:hypothetical protein